MACIELKLFHVTREYKNPYMSCDSLPYSTIEELVYSRARQNVLRMKAMTWNAESIDHHI